MAYLPEDNVAVRSEAIKTLIRGIAAQNFIMKAQVPRVESSSDWKQSYYTESIKTWANISTGSAARTPLGIPRFAAFPEDDVLWQKTTVREIKFGAQGTISLEDALTSVIDIEKRTAARIANRIVNMIDTHIFNIVTEANSSGVPQTTNIRGVTNYSAWDNPYLPSRRPMEDVARAKAAINDSVLQSYRADTLLVNSTDSAYVASSDSVLTSFDATGPNVAGTGVLGKLWGLNVIESPVVYADYAVVLQARVCAAYQEVLGLQTNVIEDPLKSRTIRSAEIGVCMLTDPKAVCLLSNTRT